MVRPRLTCCSCAVNSFPAFVENVATPRESLLENVSHFGGRAGGADGPPAGRGFDSNYVSRLRFRAARARSESCRRVASPRPRPPPYVSVNIINYNKSESFAGERNCFRPSARVHASDRVPPIHRYTAMPSYDVVAL
ncbi:hypothetical protein EVAR_19825_1 [Eumeta japonica]|uniref:Uncharacterized protein n=1 Tax=Eumeta variegata TaxID=151549 RepID=A0A4C1US28_EUMVA|nr:hypothetical protein EVAR_19825_1 [Eumeta japonica]